MSAPAPDHYRAKHPQGTLPDPKLAAALAEIVEDGRFTCPAALRLAEKLGVDPAELGRTADLLEYRIIRCGLGLFGYEPEKRIVTPAAEVSTALRGRLEEAVTGGAVECASLLDIAQELGIEKLAVSAACETLRLKIVRCRLGAW